MTKKSLSDRFDPISAPSYEELMDIIHTAHKDEPVFYWEKGDMWIVTRYDSVSKVLLDDKGFSAKGKLSTSRDQFTPEAWSVLEGTTYRNGSTPVMGSEEGEEHLRLRKPFQGPLSPRDLATYESLVRETCENLLDELAPRGRAEWLSEFGKPFPMRVVLAVLGLPAQDAARLGKWSDDLISLTTSSLAPEEQLRCAESVSLFQQYMREAIAECRAHPDKPGMMSSIIRGVDVGSFKLNDDELVASFTVEMLLGGHETTAAALVSGLYHLLVDRSERWERVVRQPGLIPNTTEELLRFEPPTLGLFRRTTAPVEIDGKQIPAGAQVYWLNMAANHDPEQFDQPACLHLERSNARMHLAFGKGRHACIGSGLARMEMNIALAALVERFPALRLAEGQKSMTYVPSSRMRMPRELHVEWTVPT